jgi:hypothetical protein
MKETYVVPRPIVLNSTIPHQTRNLIIVTLDGFRWQEVFRGADSTLLHSTRYVKDSRSFMNQQFWAPTQAERRRKLLPFLWGTVAKQGKIYGNRTANNLVNVTNPYWISYPGYNEIFTGYGDPRINSNGFGIDPNYNILEFLNQQPGFGGDSVAAVCEWGKFTDMLSVKRNGLHVIAGAHKGSPVDRYLSDSTNQSIRDYGITLPILPVALDTENFYDYQVYLTAKSYLMRYKPRVLYMSFAGTDADGHHGRYDQYLKDAYNIDQMVSDLWQYVQTDPQYQDNTTLFITTDHGRGTGDEWTNHGYFIDHSDQIWFAVMGPDTQPLGEIRVAQQLYQKQFAKSLVAFLGFRVQGIKGMGEAITGLMDR